MSTLVEFNKKNENPFQGLSNCLRLLSLPVTNELLNSSWEEVKNNKQNRQMFFSLLFSIGDVTNRQHNIFGNNKIDSGGSSERDKFFTIVEWLKLNHYEQFKKFMYAHLFNEFTCFDNLLRNRVVTLKNTNKVTKTYNMLSHETYRKDLAEYLMSIIKGNNPFDKMLVAKFLTPPRLGVRKGCKSILPERLKAMKDKNALLLYLSKLMNWVVVKEKWGDNFIGYREWRKDYNFELESKLFSTGKINEFDRDEFINWLNKLPATARFRVKNKIYYVKNNVFKYPNLRKWYIEWENFKTIKLQEVRDLTEKIRQGVASDEDILKLKEVSKEAKVTTGGTNFKELYEDIKNKRVDKLKLESFLKKVNLPYNSLVIIDDSGSMRGEPFNFATFIASVCLSKNPDDNGRNTLGFFSEDCIFYGYIDKMSKSLGNSILSRSSNISIVNIPFINPDLSFYDNYQNVDNFANCVFSGGGTNPTSIIHKLDKLIKDDPHTLDNIKNYPIWTIISDGDMNSFVTSHSSMDNFFKSAEKILGFKPFIILIDINVRSSSKSTDFEGISNFIHIQNDPVKIEQILVNFKDADVMDVYTPLNSIYRSNRYELVRANTL